MKGKVSFFGTLIFVFFLSSCSGLYRVTIGSGSAVGRFKSKVLNDSSKEVEREICVKETDTVSKEECVGGGIKSYSSKGKLDGWLETAPSYFGESSWGWGQFYTISAFKTTLIDYPVDGEETEVDVSRLAMNPFVFYNFGDKSFNDGKGLSARIGGGISLSYQLNFSLKRSSTGEKFNSTKPFQMGASSFFEICWNWLTIRSEVSQIYFNGAKFPEISNEQLTLSSGKTGLYYTYYFK
ncbi:MAG: hypothetical protein CME68_10615 [Halobacteriovoraceae bacterium]|nr:hypothetical protein [Halobacteriovoraceae bacterium]